jgi:hypothetical protein
MPFDRLSRVRLGLRVGREFSISESAFLLWPEIVRAGFLLHQ